MLSKIKEFLDKDSNSIKDCLDVGIVPYNNLIDNFEQLNIVYKDLNEDIPKMDLCFVNNTIPKETIEKINENTDILISLGSCINFKPDLVIPGPMVSDEFLNKVIQALIDDNIEYLKPLLVMTKENDFRRKTILITVKNELCTGCSGCAFICPALAIEMKNTRPNLDLKKCIHCGSCFVICPKSWNLHEEVEAWF